VLTSSFPTFRRLEHGIVHILWRISPMLADLLLIGMIVWAVLNVRWDRAVEKELESLRRRGEPVSITELVPSRPPDGENATLVYQKVFRVTFDHPTRAPELLSPNDLVTFRE